MLKHKAVWTDKPTAIREGEWVARWLNEPTTPERERIAILFRRIEIVLATPDTKAGSEEGFDEIRSANQTLGQYVRKPEISIKRGKTLYIGWAPVGEMDLHEWMAAGCVIHLAEHDLLDRLRRCPWCSRWFYARVSHKTHCTPQHYQEQFRSKPEFKAHRKEYARNYYHDVLSPKAARRRKAPRRKRL
jgi:hypothetical protein